MAPTHSRPPSLPCIPDVDFDLDEKSQLLPELDDMLSLTGYEDSATLDEESQSQISRSRSTRTTIQFELQPRRIPIRFPSSSSSSSSHHTYATIPFTTPFSDLTPQPQTQTLQLPPAQKTVLESWTITYHLPTTHTTSWTSLLGITWLRRTQREEGSILSVTPNTHFSQAELAATVAMHEAATTEHKSRGLKGRLAPKQTANGSGSGTVAEPPNLYATDLESRMRALDWKVQDEIYELLSDRTQSSSSAFRRREWRVVVLSSVPGGEMTDAPTGHGPAVVVGKGGKLRKRSRGRGIPLWGGKKGTGMETGEMPITEYRLVLRGVERKVNDQGWGYYNRYSRPWKAADEKELGERRRWSSVTGRSDKYVDF